VDSQRKDYGGSLNEAINRHREVDSIPLRPCDLHSRDIVCMGMVLHPVSFGDAMGSR